MFIFAQEMGSQKIQAPFLIYLVWKGSWSAQLRAVIGHLYGQLTSSIIWKHTGEQNETVCCYDLEKVHSVFEMMLGFDTDKLYFLYFNMYSYLIKKLSVHEKMCCSSRNEKAFCCFPGTTAPSPAQPKAVGKVSTSCRDWRCTWELTMVKNPLCAQNWAVVNSSQQLETWRTTYEFTLVCFRPPLFLVCWGGVFPEE